ncbi:hypothetical protein D5I55_17840 [Chakrabartia godavariana]|nr:hypothetical protein D5I55_17840 [Chakrabartia godavariana]
MKHFQYARGRAEKARASGVKLTTRVTREALEKRLRTPPAPGLLPQSITLAIGSGKASALLRCNIT